MAVTSLAKSHATFVDCTDGKLDALPSESCPDWDDERGLSLLGLLIYCVLCPLAMLLVLRCGRYQWKQWAEVDIPRRKDVGRIRDECNKFCGCCRPSPESFEDSYAFVLKKYTPQRWWFEVVVIFDKVVRVFFSGACSLHL